jgi:hypothetical protein
MPRGDADDWLERAARAHGRELGPEAHAMLATAVAELSSLLTDDERAHLAGPIPECAPLAEALPAEPSIDAVVDRVARRLRIGRGRAAELVAIAGELLGARIDASARARILRDLPPALAALLAPVDRAGKPTGHTLLRAPHRARTAMSEAPAGGHRPAHSDHAESDRSLATARPSDAAQEPRSLPAPVRRGR